MEDYLKANEVIILNASFKGDWNQKEDNIGHEIINYFRDDNGDLWIYNTPLGDCPDQYVLNNDSTDKKLYKIKYFLIVEKINTKKIKILYKINLEKKISKEESEKISNQIRYGGVLLSEIFSNSSNENCKQFITFKAKSVEKYDVTIDIVDEYKFQRGRGIIKKDEHKELFNSLVFNIENYKEKRKFIDVELETLKNCSFENNDSIDILNLIGKLNDEEAFTLMIYNMLQDPRILSNFLNYLVEKKYIETKSNDYKDFVTEKEKVIDTKYENGMKSKRNRLDLLIHNKDTNIVFENKINSDLNNIRKDGNDNHTQLYDYWLHYENEKKIDCSKKKNYYFVFCPDYNVNEIIKSIDKNESDNIKNIYKILPYSEIIKGLFGNETNFDNYLKTFVYNALKYHSVDELQHQKQKILKRIETIKKTDKYDN